MGSATLNRELNDHLLVEMGWPEVAKGLTRILVGYGIWIGGNVLGLTLVLLPLIEVGFKIDSPRLRLGQLWMFYAGLGILSVVGLIAFGFILGGKWRCLISASERHGCRWLMFLCMATMAMSLALSILSSVSGMRIQPEFSRGVAGFSQVRFTTAGVLFNLASALLSMAYTCTFALFLRAVALCMGSRWHVRMVDLFLSFFFPLAIATGYLAYKLASGDFTIINPLLFLGAGWIICFLFWLTMIFLVRCCVFKTIERVRAPMAYSDMDEAALQKRKFSFSQP
jgi:hypothetical protein